MLVGFSFSPRGHTAAYDGLAAEVSAAVAQANLPNLLPRGWPLGWRLHRSRNNWQGGPKDTFPSHWSDGASLFSYETCLLQRDSETGDLLYNATTYSVTTSKYQGRVLQVTRAVVDVVPSTRVRHLYDVPFGTKDLIGYRRIQRLDLNRLGVA